MTALTFISTAILSFPITFTGGYVHLGDALVLSCGVVLGKKYGALAAGIGSALADIQLGYVSWAIPTLIIKALMAYIIGYMFEDDKNINKLLTLTGIYVLIWSLFNFFLRSIISAQALLLRADELISADVVTDTDEIVSLASTTSNILLIAAVVVPVFVILFIIMTRSNESIGIHINHAVAFIVAGSAMVVLYYITYGVLYGSWVVPIFSVPTNMLQYGVGVFLGLLLLPLTKRLSLIEPIDIAK